MKTLTRFLTSELGFFIIVTTILMAFSMAPTVKRYLTTPPDRVFDGLEYYSDDYSIYVSNMLQGQRGRWTLLDKHTTEPHQGTIIHDEYLLWGKFAGLFHVDQIEAYHLARLTFGVILLGMIYLLLLEIFPNRLQGTGGSPRVAPKLGSPCGNIFGAAGRQDPSQFKRQLAFFLITFFRRLSYFCRSRPK